MKMSERCTCGATIEVTSDFEQTVQDTVKEWRRKHKHNYPSYYNPARGPWNQNSPFTVTSNGTITASQLPDTGAKTTEKE
jgi:hypothetical protein